MLDNENRKTNQEKKVLSRSPGLVRKSQASNLKGDLRVWLMFFFFFIRGG